MTIEEIDLKISIILSYRDSEYVKKYPDLRSWLCDTIGHIYSLQCCIISDIKLNKYSTKFFKANVAVNRHYRDWNLHEVADIYNELRKVAENYLDEENLSS